VSSSPVASRAADDPDRIDALVRRLKWAGLAVVLGWLALLIGWSVSAPISGAVVAGGLVKVEANRQTVSHRDGGIVAKVLVREGETVRKGQTLIVLEDARVDSSVDLLAAQLDAERVRRARLEAEVAFRPQWSPDAKARDGADARLLDAMSRERATFDARRRTLVGQVEALEAQRRDTEGEVQARVRDGAASSESERLLREELASNEALAAQDFVNRTRVLTLKRGVAEYQSRVQTNEAELAKARQRVSELAGRAHSLRDAYHQTAVEELRESQAKSVDLEERLRAGRDTAAKQTIVAPADGRLVDLRVNTVGSAIGPRQAVVDVVPADAPLVVEVRVGADAIGEVQVGLPAEVKLLTIKQRSTHMVDAKVVRVSADALTEERSGTPYFAVQVEMQRDSLAALPGVSVLPGLAAEVYIKTGERTPLDFLLDPFLSGLRRSFREH
jgi:epimerase transport system membrane fusion protein